MLVVSAYQGEKDEDKDPDGPGCLGITHNGRNECALYLEAIREDGDPMELDMAHEVSHGSGTPDHPMNYPDECVMRIDSQNHLGHVFCDSCINEMRKDSNW
jgi:hypothetical protein